jgi:hypothetical protein
MILKIKDEEIKRQLISFAVTFASVFLITFGTNLSQTGLPETLEVSALISLLLAIVRSAVKIAFEQAVKPLFAYLVSKYVK